MKLIFLNVVCFFYVFNCFSQKYYFYEYDVCNESFKREDLKQKELINKQSNLTTITIIPFDTFGSMKFKKYFNGLIFLEGKYERSRKFKSEKISVINPYNDKEKIKKSKTFYPTKCGTWYIYSLNKVIDSLIFKPCGGNSFR